MGYSIRKIITYCVMYTITFVLAIASLLRLIFVWLTKPSGTVFKVKNRPIPPACLNDPQLGEHKYVQLKNVKLHYVEKGDKTKPLMLFLHGFPEFWYSWRHQIKEFSEDYWVVAPDLRGYGDSEKPDGIKFYHAKYIVEDIKNLVEALERDKIILVAHDWGGLIAWYFVMLYPDLIDTYIIMNAPHPLYYTKQLSTNFTQFRMSWYVFFFQTPYLPELMMRLQDLKALNLIFRSKKRTSPYSEEDKEAYRFTFGKPGAFTPPLNYYRANFGLTSEFSKSINRNVKLPPGLMIFGKRDLAIHLDTVKILPEKIPNLTLEVIDDATHFVQQDDPDRVNQLMQDFLEKLPKLKIKDEQEIK